MAKDGYDKELARFRHRKIHELDSSSKRLERDDRDRLQHLLTEMKQGGLDWSPNPDDGQWVDRKHRDHFAKWGANVDRERLWERASQEWVLNSLTETNRQRLLSILDTPVEKWSQGQIDWVERMITEAEMKAEDDGQE